MMRRAAAPFAVSLLAALLAAVGSWLGWFAALDKAWYDYALRAHPLEYPEDIAIVAIDEASLDRLGAWPWDRRYHAALLDKLQGARAVVFDLLFAEPQSVAVLPAGVAGRHGEHSADHAFAAAIAANGKVLMPVFIEQQQFRGLMQEILPIPQLAGAVAALGHAHVEYERDGIARGVYLRMGLGKPYWPHLALALAELNGELTPAQQSRWAGSQELASPYQVQAQHFVRLRFSGPPRTLYRFSYTDVLEGRVPRGALQDRIVYVGATATGLGDDVPSPYGAMPGVEFHANAYHALRSDGLVAEFTAGTAALLHGALALVACLLLSRLTPRAFLLGTLAAVATFTLLVLAFFFFTSWWIAPTPFFAGMLLFYPLWSWRRIEIAMGFLRRELAELQRAPGEQAPALDQLREQLDALVELGALQAAGIEELGEAGADAYWPAHRLQGAALSSAFVLDDKHYRMTLVPHVKAAARQEWPLATLACLMDEIPVRPRVADDSYELVERTIDEIYATRTVVERTQDRMNESMARLQDVVVVSDIAGRIIFVNDRATSYFEPGLAGKAIIELQRFIGKLAWHAILRQLMVAGEQVYREVETHTGKLLLCQAARLAEAESSRDTLLFVFTDVTELRALEQGKNEALAFLSHDMRSPLVSQLALIESFRISDGKFAGQDSELLDRLVYFAERSLKYSEDFLQLARAENLDQESFQLVDLHGVVDAAVAEVAGLAVQSSVRLEIHRTGEDCWTLGDTKLLERAVSNLLSNAIQHSPPGELVTASLEKDDRLAIGVADRGSGIDAETLPHLFKPYFRARERGDAPRAGGRTRNYGLGLSFVHSVVERHGGEIQVHSSPGAGTHITIYLPETEVD